MMNLNPSPMKKIILPLLVILSLYSGKSSAQCAAMFQWFVQPGSTTVQFSDSSVSGGLPFSYSWNFGDGSPVDNTQNPVHAYATNGTYTVCLTIFDAGICADSVCRIVSTISPPNSINVYFDVDSSGMFACTSPHSVDFMGYVNTSGYSPGDLFQFEINFGDGIDSTFSLTFPNMGFQGTFPHAYLNAGTYTAQLTVTGPDTISGSYTSQPVTVSSSCGSVSGTVYNDINNNCIYDSGEELQNIGLTISNGSQLGGWTNTDANGLYSFNVPAGSVYDVHVQSLNGINAHFSPSCPPSGILTVNTVPSSGNNFGVACPVGFDLQGNISGWGFRPGFTGSVCVSAFNQSCTTPDGQIEITLSPNLTPLPDTTGIGYTVTGNTVTFTIDSTKFYWSFCIPVLVSVNAQIGDSACFDLNITPTIGDINVYNNTGSFCFEIRNSWDPNDKAANPAGEGVDGFIRPNTDLTYTIRFQNTGNADAINIYILDTLSPNLDASSFEIIGYSHPMTYSLLTGNILRFNFDNIHLLDSNTNEPASHGYVTYRIKQSPSIAQLAQITNTAYIYFDFNPAIVTNTTLNTMDQFLSVPVINKNSTLVNLFPNPANQKSMIYFGDNHRRTISVTDILGKEVFRVTSSTESYLLSTEKFVNGIYTIQIKDEKNQIQTGKLIIAH